MTAMRGLRIVPFLLTPFLASAASPGGSNSLPSLGKEESAQVLSDFRNSGLPCDLVMRFELRHLPREGDASAPETGTIWMTWRHGQPAVRVEIGANRFLLLRKDGQSTLLKSTGGPAVAIPPADALKPLLTGHVFAPFDLQAPFTHWAGTAYERTERRRGRPLNLFLAKAPAGAQPAAVRFGLDRAYLALIEATSLDAAGKPLRLMLIEDFAQVDKSIWILGKASVRDELTRDRDTLEVREACIDARLPATLFTPESLASPAPATAGTFHRL